MNIKQLILDRFGWMLDTFGEEIDVMVCDHDFHFEAVDDHGEVVYMVLCCQKCGKSEEEAEEALEYMMKFFRKKI